MSIVREPSPTSRSRVVRESSVNKPLGRTHPSLTSSNRETLIKQLAPSNGGRNEALTAAFLAGTGKQKAARMSKNAIQMYDNPPMPYLSLASSETNEKNSSSTPSSHAWTKSTSHIAALLAVSKSLPMQSTGHSTIPPPRRTNLQKTGYDSNLPEMQTDKIPTPSTTSLIKLFESQMDENHSSRPGGEIPRPHTSQAKLRSPTQTRPVRKQSIDSKLLRIAEPGKFLEKSKPSIEKPTGGFPWTAKTSEDAFDPVLKTPLVGRSEESEITIPRKGPAPAPPPPRRTRRGNEVVDQDRPVGSTFTQISEGNSSPSSYTSAVARIELPTRGLKSAEHIPITRIHPSLSPNQQSDLPGRPSISPLGAKNSFGKDDHLWVGRQHSRESTLDPRSRTPQLTADSLANAMVASSLASSRNSSPSISTPPLPRRQSKAQSIFRRSQSQEIVQSRTPSPGRVMRQTMRETPKSDEEESRKRTGGNILNKHPNKHKEGDRKRWRDEIAERERKRYEGVWAANKGLLVPSELPHADSTVLNLVVRDIWRRSRLPNEVLAEVWDLVDNSRVGRLSKEEFVVGMWLIDQRLKGRKLPLKVSESVWFSVRRLSGLKAPR